MWNKSRYKRSLYMSVYLTLVLVLLSVLNGDSIETTIKIAIACSTIILFMLGLGYVDLDKE